MNLQHLLDDERRREAERQGRRMPRRRVVLLVGVVGAVIAIGTGAALTAAAVSEINEYEHQAAAFEAPAVSPSASGSAKDTMPAMADPAPSTSPVPASGSGEASATGESSASGEDGLEPAPGGVATIRGYTVYDESSDIDLIPRPSPEFVEKWAIDVETLLMQNHLDAVCMAEKGFSAAFIPIWQSWENGDSMAVIDEIDAFNDAWTPEWREAMYGADDQPLGEDYDWKQAGCHGAAVHYTGMDGVH